MEQLQIVILPVVSVVIMSEVWLVTIMMEQSQILIPPAVSMVLIMSAVWLVIIEREQSTILIPPVV